MHSKNFLKIVGLIVVLGMMLLWMEGCKGDEEETSKTAEEQFIEERHALLEETAKEEPGRVIRGQVVFKTYIDSDEIIDLIKANNIKLITVNFSSEGYVGGYRPQNGENDPKKVIAALIMKEKDFVDFLLKDTENLLQNPWKSIDEELLKDELQRLRRSRDLLEEGRIFLYGFEGEGKAIDFKSFKDKQLGSLRLANPALSKDLRINLLPPQQ